MAFDFSGKCIVVAGGSRGIGRSIALAFASAGADVSICARGAEALAATREEIARHGVRVHAASCDLARADEVAAYVADAAAALGGIDVLVNNASGFGMGDSEDAWQLCLDVDVMAMVRASHAAEAELVKRPGSSVVHIASISGYGPSTRAPAYAAAKAAMMSYTRSQAAMLSSRGVRVNCIAPGWRADRSCASRVCAGSRRPRSGPRESGAGCKTGFGLGQGHALVDDGRGVGRGAEFRHPAAHVQALRVVMGRLLGRRVDAQRVDARGARLHLHLAPVDAGLEVEELPRQEQPRLAPVQPQVVGRKADQHGAHAEVQPAGGAQLAHAGVDHRVARAAFAPGLQAFGVERVGVHAVARAQPVENARGC
jgi:3-oxoacyl-[acyl-carrier protein] reductase